MNIRVVLLLCLILPQCAAAASLADRRSEFRRALDGVERGQSLVGDDRRALLDHPLFSYIEYAELRRGLKQATPAAVEDFARRHPGHPQLARLQDSWLQELARRGEWRAVAARAGSAESTDSRCHVVHARLKTAPDAAAWTEAEALWRTGRSAPSACDPVFAALSASGRLTPALRWARIELAAAEGNAGLMRFLARSLPAEEQALATGYADFIDSGAGNPASWPQDQRSAEVLGTGIARLARRDSDRAERLLEAHKALLGRSPEALQRAWHGVALWTAASYQPAAAARFAKVPDAAYDTQLHEWRVREALSREDWRSARKAIAAMPEALREGPRWRYAAARLDQIDGRQAEAEAGFALLAQEAHYHGFLAADRLGSPYPLCPLDLPRDAALRGRVGTLPGIQNALELHALGRYGWALGEWKAAIAGLPDLERRVAVELAVDSGWTDRAVFDLSKGDDLRYYRLRFPLAYQKHLTREAGQRDLDPAWVAALIRAESAWNPAARSHANARGLMQLLPGTGQDIARKLGISWSGASDLYQPRSNITLGTEYLADMLARKAEQPFLATAAYNAGPAPIARWRSQRPPREVDLWIETIPYWETRDYVVRVMAFSVIYDWRLGQDAYPLSERLRAQPDRRVARSPFACPAPASVARTSP
ncbi:transglycosylase SLT domain-containing protein [Pseudomarimonas salicorniae]|uniref:Transglycosylase SLT domain-containing protein n=1 Tax=Pseudomarimonas salicorniae TaxID=2933270 RepID=A0ABT0GFR1_9GAMM|nr:transglycosylase SLT domain-containing protein [Lysobacter sp. CAU 1642]MCK7593379.1 transglycosylase SLT domain-containing protein [Lysobacter sp. CAU 1642]